MLTIQDPSWEPPHSLVEDAGRDCSSCLPSGSGRCTVASLPPAVVRGLYAAASSPLLLAQSLFCEQARLGFRAFCSGVLFFFPLSLAIPQFGLLSHDSSLRLSSGHSGLALTLSTHYAAVPPCPAPLAGGSHKHPGYFLAGSSG